MKTGESHFKQIMNNFFTSGLHEDCDIEILRKVRMINVMTLIALIILIPFGIIDLNELPCSKLQGINQTVLTA